ncbi:MAG: peptidylprolyl isomerase [Rhizobiaceae bacterium]
MPSHFRTRLAACGVAFGLLAGAALAQETAPAAPAADPAAVVASVNGKQITEGDITLALEELGQQFGQLPEEQRRAAALSALIEIHLMAGEATAKGIDKDPTFQRRLALLQGRALHAAVIDEEIAGKITEEDVRARYDRYVSEMPPVNEVKASHILVKTKEEADAIVKRLDAGEDFATIAKELSQDPGSGANGGDLGYFGPGQMVPEFEKAAFALEVGQYTKEPVQSQFGWHIIKVEDKRQQQPPAFEDVKEQVRSLVLRERYVALLKTLREGGSVEITDPALKAAVDGVDKAQ